MTDGSAGRVPVWLSTAITLAAIFLAIGVAFTGLALFSGYLDYSKAYWGQQQCVEEYGDGAEYVGEPSAFSSTGICEVDGEQHFIDVEQHGMAPVGEYLFGGGVA